MRRATIGSATLLGVLGIIAPAWALPVLPGDINLDGKVNVSDVQCHVLASANPDAPPDCMKASPDDADVSCDGSVNVSDLQMTVLLAVGNPLSSVVDPDGDARVGDCDPDRDGDSWSDACEAVAGTNPEDPANHPASATECAGAPLSTACRLSGTAGATLRCDVRLARLESTIAASTAEAIVQVDPTVARIEQIDTVRVCTDGLCSYGGTAPPTTDLPSGAPLWMLPSCTSTPCTTPWSLGKVGVTTGTHDGPALTNATWTSPNSAVAGEGFLVSVVTELLVDSSDVAIEVFGGRARTGVEPFDANLLPTSQGAVLVTEGPAGNAPCTEHADCDDNDPCTVDSCVDGSCDTSVAVCDDGLSCTTDTCTADGCITALEAGTCLVAGSCQVNSNPACAPLVRLSEVAPSEDGGWIEFVHEGPAVVRLDTLTVSVGDAPWPIPPVTVPPFGTVVIQLGSGTDTHNVVHADEALTTMAWAGGEVILWENGVMADYVAWGNSGHPSLEIAGANDHWSHGESLVVDAVPAGYSLQSGAGEGASTWNAAATTPTAGTMPCALVDCVEVACHDGEDGDFDTHIDCEDPDCATGTGCTSGTAEICDDDIDNDDNGLADCLDQACALNAACPAQPVLNEVAVEPGGDTRIELTNVDVAPIPVSALAICTPTTCVPVPGDGSLYPASFLTVHTGTGTDTPTDRWLNGALGDFSVEAGELLLVESTPATAESTWSYIRWSAGTNPTAPEGSLEEIATTAGVWAPGTHLYVDAFQPGDTLARNPAGEGMAWEWDVHTGESVGYGNPNCGSTDQCRETRCEDATDEDGDGGFDCADADCDGWTTCHVRVVLNEVHIDGSEGDIIEISNLGDGVASLVDRTLSAGGPESFALAPAVQLGPGDVLILRAGDGENSAGTLYGLPFDLEASGGELSLTHGGLDDYVRWGIGTSAVEGEAVAAGQWQPDEAVDTTEMDPANQTLAYDGWGDRASDWSIDTETIGAENAIEFGHCGDGLDNDEDTLSDCWDDDCSASPLCSGELCGNDIDDDADGNTDCEDIACQDKGPCLETGQCDDGVDNDGDGETDCHDTEDCGASDVCNEAFLCADDVDNDVDGLTDCEDEDCTGSAGCIETGNCDDGIDNDANGLTDCAEQVACGGEVYCQEPGNCADGIDNDVDGLTDCDDTIDCTGKLGCVEFECSDLVDDDNDGDVDCDDDDCALLPVCVGASPIFALTELYLDSPLDTQVIELSNIGPATGQGDGLILCAGTDCFTVPADTTIKPGESVVLETGTGDDFEAHRFMGDALAGLSSDAGALGLYTAFPTEDPSELLDFVQWGNPGQDGENLADDAGQWIAGEAIPSASYLTTLTSYTWLGTGEGAAHWAIHFTPTPGAPNPSCESPGSCAELDCEDGEDGDGDEAIDCHDGDCAIVATCLIEAHHCDDTLDNDSDGLADCADVEECADHPLCNEATHCDDQIDNDTDGDVDCEDDDCTGHPYCSEALHCADQVDNDADGLYDCQDPACSADPACTETGDECGDNYDNDLDGAIDCADTDCVGAAACREHGQCWDAVDNDDDGDTDCADAACSSTQPCAPRARLTEIVFDAAGHGTIEIGNPGSGEIAAAFLWVCVNDTCIQIPEHAVPLTAAGTLGIHSTADEDVAGHSYLDSPWGLDISGGSVRLYGATDAAGEPSLLLDYAAWGSPGQVGEAEAVDAGHWPADTAIPTDALAVGGALGRYGVTHEPWRWTIWLIQTATSGGQVPCQPGFCHETWCDDGRDNDLDGLRDCEDPDCVQAAGCLEVTHCRDTRDNDGDTDIDCYDTDCAAAADCSQAARFSELALDVSSGGDDIELINPFATTLSLGGARLCSDLASCYTIPPGVTLDAGMRLAIHAGTGGGPNSSLLAGDALGDLSSEAGSLTLTDGGAADDPGAILAFVDWGTQAGVQHEAAAAAGVWRLGDRIETQAFVSGFDSLIGDGETPDASAWTIATSTTAGTPNPNCAVASSCRESRCFDGLDEDDDALIDCQDPDCSQVPGCLGRMVINEVHLGDGTPQNPAWVELANLGLGPIDAAGWRLCAGGACHVIEEGEYPGGDIQALVLADGTDNGSIAYVGESLGDLSIASGSLALHGPGALDSPENLMDYVAWGVPPFPASTLSVAAGQWLPNDMLPVSGLGPHESLHYQGIGDGAFAWIIAIAPSRATINQSCSTPGTCRELDCDDGVDRDFDGLVDCADPDCGVAASCDESANCANGLDDDADGHFDCMDLDCAGDTACVEALLCDDTEDNDLDGFVDCEDIECGAKHHCNEAMLCDDGIDNDLDGLTDCFDPHCGGVDACPESSHCDDATDNDLDGLVDCDDDDCADASECDESIHCDDGVDNDLDGMTDCSDDACTGQGGCTDGLACNLDDFNALSCGQQAGGFLQDAPLWNPNGACGFEFEDSSYLFQMQAPCSGKIVLVAVKDISDDVFILRLDGTCHTASWCEVAGGDAAIFEECPVAGNGTNCMQMEFQAVAGEDYFFVFQRTDGSTGDGEFGVQAFCAECSESGCDDNIDNDLDELIDCADPDCGCDEAIACDNGVDDDGDGLTDCADDVCFDHLSCDESAACQDGVDQDLDGLTDCDDPDCPHYVLGDQESYCAASEGTDAPFASADACSDGVDNDGDALTDCEDSDCATSLACTEIGQCDDALDNNGDGYTDCSDASCATDPLCSGGTLCAHHSVLGCGSTVTHVPSVVGSNVLGGDYCGHGGEHAGSDEVIYKVTSPCEGMMKATLSHDADGTYAVSALEGICRSTAYCGETPWVAETTGDAVTLEWPGHANIDTFLVVEGHTGTSGAYSLTVTCTGCPEAGCNDGVDNDGDDLVDCDDTDCSTVSPCAVETGCADGTDDDLDGLTDCDDVDCAGLGDCHYACIPADLPCGSNTIVDLASTNEVTDVITTYACSAHDYAGAEKAMRVLVPSGCEPTVSIERLSGTGYIDILSLDTDSPECSPETCDNMGAMDADGRAQLALGATPPGQHHLVTLDGRDGFVGPARVAVSCCTSPVESFCGDGIDDDLDGATDCQDNDCSDVPACVPETACGDSVDNDQDGSTDCEDSNCNSSPLCTETNCADGADSDDDGSTDCDDADCEGTLACTTPCASYQELTCGAVTLGQSTEDGQSVYTDYTCASTDDCTNGGYPGPEQSYVVVPPCDTDITVEVYYEGGHSTFFAAHVGQSCDESAQSCDTPCGAPGTAAVGTDTQPVLISFPGQSGKAHWFNVESAAPAEAAGTSYAVSVQCTCP